MRESPKGRGVNYIKFRERQREGGEKGSNGPHLRNRPHR